MKKKLSAGTEVEKRTAADSVPSASLAQNGLLPSVFQSVNEAVEALKLDRRHKWEEFGGELVHPYWYSHACSGCTEIKEYQSSPERGSGCNECGYTGRRRNVVPIPAFMPDGSIVKVRLSNGG